MKPLRYLLCGQKMTENGKRTQPEINKRPRKLNVEEQKLYMGSDGRDQKPSNDNDGKERI